MSDFLLSTTIIPVPKNKYVNATDSGNYVGIALRSVIAEFFEHVFLDRYTDSGTFALQSYSLL